MHEAPNKVCFCLKLLQYIFTRHLFGSLQAIGVTNVPPCHLSWARPGGGVVLRECHRLTWQVVTDMGMGCWSWQFSTPEKPIPMTWVWRICDHQHLRWHHHHPINHHQHLHQYCTTISHLHHPGNIMQCGDSIRLPRIQGYGMERAGVYGAPTIFYFTY